MQKKFESNLTKIKGGCQSGRVVTNHSKSDLPLVDDRKIAQRMEKIVKIHLITMAFFLHWLAIR